MWSHGFGSALAGIVGVLALIVGAITLLTPKKTLGERRWFNAIYIFYGLGLSLLVLEKL
jgi:hypothetical protein